MLVVVKVGLSPKASKIPLRASGRAPEFHSLTHSPTHSLTDLAREALDLLALAAARVAQPAEDLRALARAVLEDLCA